MEHAVGITLALAGAGWILLGAVVGGAGLLLCWLGVSFFYLAMAYLIGSPGPLGKRADGRLSPAVLLLTGPGVATVWLTWLLHRRVAREAPWHEIRPGLFLGRRVAGNELPPQVGLVVDLTAELWEPAAVRSGQRYRCLPTLDGTAPAIEGALTMVEEIAAAPAAVYVHCASGHGRSAALVAALLVREGSSPDPETAILHLRQLRPGVHLNAGQRRFVRRLCESRMAQPY